MMQTLASEKRVSRVKAKEIFEAVISYLEKDVKEWLKEIQCRDTELVKTLIGCLVQDFIKEKFDCEIEDFENRITFSRLDEDEEFIKLR